MKADVTLFRLSPVLLLLVLAGCEVVWDGQSADDLGNADNLAPGLTLDAPDAAGSYGTAAAIPFSGTVTDDADPTGIYLTITSNLDGLIDRPPVLADGTFGTEGLLSAGAHQITATATDAGGLQATVSVSIQVLEGGAGAPLVDVAMDPDPPIGRTWTACVITAEDPTGLPVTVESRWLVNGSDAGTAEDEINKLLRDDELTCEVTATSAGGATEAVITRTVANSPPEVDEIRIDGAPADENDRLACSADPLDYDYDDVTLIFEWLVNGTVALTGSTGITGTHFDRDDEVVCRITPDDGMDLGDPLESDVQIIVNSPPWEPSGISVTPETARSGAGLTCNVAVNGSDLDTNDILVNDFRWTVDGVEQAGASSQVFGTTGIAEGQVITCSARTSDGDLTSAWVDADNTATVTPGLSGTYDGADAVTTISGTTGGDRLGRALAAAGDLDGDGVPELALGANQHDSNRGRVFLFDGATVAAGGALDDTDALLDWTGPQQGALFAGGEAIVGTGDVTGGGVADLLAAAYRADDVGAVYLFAGEDLGSWTGGAAEDEAALVFRGEATGDDFALDVGSADVDGDGLADVFAGAPFHDGAGESAGMVTVYLAAGLPSSGDVAVGDADHAFEGETAGDLVGYAAMVSLGDVDADGYDDFAVGARDARNSANAKAGSLFILSGADFTTGGMPAGGTLADAATHRIDGEAADDQLGMGAATLGDLDLDGADDFAVGTRYADIQTIDAGGVHVFFGGSLAGTTSAADADASFGSAGGSDLAGKNLVSGDADGDGFRDLMVSSHYYDGNGSNSGSAWLLLGGDWASWGPGGTLAGSAQAEFQGNSNNDYMSSMSDFVDLDADGADELVIGADGDDSSQGTVYIFTQP